VPILSVRRTATASLVLILAACATASSGAATPAPAPTAHVAKNDKNKDKGNNGNNGNSTNSTNSDDTSGLSTNAASGASSPGDDSQGDDNSKNKSKDKGSSTPAATTPPPAPARGPAAAPTSSAPATTAPASGAPASTLTDPPAPPQLGVTVGLTGASGTVMVRAADGAPLQSLSTASALPTGTHIDTRNGSVDLTSAIDAAGTTQTGHFSGGIFEVRQAPEGKGVTQLVLVGGAWGACKAATAATASTSAVAHAAGKRKAIRRLWGTDDHGRFVTKGRGSVATVRGTKWLTEDFCDGTRTTVAQGAVAVRDLARHKTVVVRAGHSYFARVAAR
jgi:hypothetical protein